MKVKITSDQPKDDGRINVAVKDTISVNIVNSNLRKESISLNMRQALNGDYMIFDHNEIDIVVMTEKKKVVAFAKDVMSNVVYGAESRLMEHLRKVGIIEFDSIHSSILIKLW